MWGNICKNSGVFLLGKPEKDSTMDVYQEFSNIFSGCSCNFVEFLRSNYFFLCSEFPENFLLQGCFSLNYMLLTKKITAMWTPGTFIIDEALLLRKVWIGTFEAQFEVFDIILFYCWSNLYCVSLLWLINFKISFWSFTIP